jgi:signal transduction histidine kinase
LDTKWKKYKPVLGWGCLCVGAAYLLMLVCALIGGNRALQRARADIHDAFQADYQNTSFFNTQIDGVLEQVFSYLTADELIDSYDDYHGEGRIFIKEELTYLSTETPNLLVSAINSATNRNFKNTDVTLSPDAPLPDGYNFLIYCSNGSIRVIKDDQNVPLSSLNFGTDHYRVGILEGLGGGYGGNLWQNYPHYTSCTVAIAVAQHPVPTNYNTVYSILGYQTYLRNDAIPFLVFTGVCLLAVIGAFLLWSAKEPFSKKLAALGGNVWIECKILLGIVLLILLFYLFSSGWTIHDYWRVYIPAFLFMTGLALLINDLRRNRGKTPIGLCAKIYRHYHAYVCRRPFQLRMLRRLRWLAIWEILIPVVTTLCCLSLGMYYIAYSTILIPLAFIAMILLFLRYRHHLKHLLCDIDTLTKQIRAIQSGDYTKPQNLAKDSELREAAIQLQQIQSGLASAVEEQVRAERMKVELITNVSHDIKTPLTSIISYIDLLQREPDLPDAVRDYTLVLSQKANRLKEMVQDVFEISKAASGNLELHLEPLDLCKLLRQTLADMSDDITASTLTFKTSLPEQPVAVLADGSRLYRVFQNLIKNALQYSLEYSRVHVQIEPQREMVLVSIKNTSKYELGAIGQNITERFVRGDASRSTEGSGLGLSIAKSFAEACGGRLSISTDADLFCANVVFKTLPEGGGGQPLDQPLAEESAEYELEANA